MIDNKYLYGFIEVKPHLACLFGIERISYFRKMKTFSGKIWVGCISIRWYLFKKKAEGA